MTKEPAPASDDWTLDLIKQTAKDIGDEVICHIETMYPGAIYAAPSTFATSVRNKIINEILCAIRINDASQIVARINVRKKARRDSKAFYRRMRAAGP